MRRKNCLDGIPHEDGPHLPIEEEKKEAEVYLAPGVVVGAGAEVEVLVQKISQDQRHLIQKGLERNHQNRKEREQKCRKEKRKGE